MLLFSSSRTEYGPKKLRIGTPFTQWNDFTIIKYPTRATLSLDFPIRYLNHLLIVEQLKAPKWRKFLFFSGKATFWILWCFKPFSFKKSPVPYFLNRLDVFFRGLNSVEVFIKFYEQIMLTKNNCFNFILF